MKRSARLALWAVGFYLLATCFIPAMFQDDWFAIVAFIVLVVVGTWFHAWSEAQRRREGVTPRG